MNHKEDITPPHYLSIEKVWPKGPLGATFLTSYTFHAPFFEAQLLPLLKARGAHPIVVFLDKYMGFASAMATLSLLYEAGRTYCLVPYDPGSYTFHPKVHLFCGSGGACLVGSGNLTPNGFGRRLEAFDILNPKTDGSAIGKVRNFFRALIERCKENISPIDQKWLLSYLSPDDDPPSGTGDAVFIHSLKKGIQEQFVELLLEGNYSELLMAAPFHNPDHTKSAELANCMGNPKVKLIADSEDAPDAPVKIVHGRFVDKYERRLHAKIVHARGLESSVLMIGSANLTSAAWEINKNIEACVVRPTLEPDEVNGWLGAAPFEETTWQSTNIKEPNNSDRLRYLPIHWARIEGNELTVSVQKIDVPIMYAIETANSIKPVSLSFSKMEGLFKANVEIDDGQPAILLARADGWETTKVLIMQINNLRMATRAQRIAEIRKLAEGSELNWANRQEVFACIGDAIAALHHYASKKDIKRPDMPVSSDKPSKKQHTKIDGASESQEEMVVKEVESLFPGLIGPKGSSSLGMGYLSKLIDALGKKTAPEDPTKPSNKWGIDDLDVASLPHSNSDSKDTSKKNTPSAEEDPDASDTLDKEADEEVKTVLKLADKAKDAVEDMLGKQGDGPASVSKAIIRTLIITAERFTAAKAVLGARLLSWLEWTWAIPDWPSLVRGWALSSPDITFPDEKEAEQSLLKAAKWLLETDPEESAIMDCAHRVLIGLNSCLIEDVENSDATLKDIPDNDPGMALFNSLKKELLEHQTMGERARALIEPLWQLDRAASQVRIITKEHERVQLQVLKKETYCHTRSPRNKNRQAVEVELIALRGALEEIKLKVENAKSKAADAEILLEKRNPNAYQQWKSSRVWKRSADIECKVFSLIDSVLPSCCNIQIPTSMTQAAADKCQILLCPKCNVLLAAGPGDIEDA